jgi:uroporphyrinogen decarboxylase
MELIDTDFFRGVLGKPGTSVPSFPIILGYSVWAYHNFTGIPAYEIMKNGKKHAAAQLYVAKKFNLPFVIAFTDLNVVGEALGAKLTYMPDVIPIHEIPAVYTADEIDALEPANPHKDGRMPVILKSCEEYFKKFKFSDNIIGAGVEGPITAAGSVWGMENLMRNMINNPLLVHKVLEVSTESIIDFLNEQLNYGLDLVILSDPSASCTCISPEFFQAFALPYFRKIAKRVNAIAILIHICGEAYDILQYLVKIPKMLAISVDLVDLEKAKKVIGNKFVVLMGNVSTAIMRYGTPKQVEAEAKKCIKKAAIGGKFMLSTACDIAPATPSENIITLINAGKKFGTFPIKPES